MSVSLVVAMAEGGVIGRGGQLPWRLSADLARFKQITWGHVIVMGRRTYESIGRLLPGRTTVVLSRSPDYAVPGATVRPNFASACAAFPTTSEIFAVGGAAVYREALPQCTRMYITHVQATVPGDVTFPHVDWSQWRQIENEPRPADERNEYACSFCVYERLA